MKNMEKQGAIIRVHKNGDVSVLCPLGHLIEYHLHSLTDGGSMFTSELAFREYGDRFDRLAWKCQGSGHEEPVQVTLMSCVQKDA
jgi:hypothetical protein